MNGINVKGIYIQAIAFDGSITYFNAKGKKVEENQYESVLRTEHKNYFITINDEGQYGIIDAKGNIRIKREPGAGKVKPSQNNPFDSHGLSGWICSPSWVL